MDTKNVIAAISLSAAVIILYSLFFAPSPQELKQVQEDKNQTIQSTDAPSLEIEEKVLEISRGAAKSKSQRIEFENNSIIGSISLKGALIDDLIFKKYEIEKSINCLSFNSNIDMNIAKQYFSDDLCFQGNLDPMLLVVGGDVMKKQVLKILANLKDRKFIFNLGHGILPQTPEKNVYELINIVKSFNK